MIFLSVDDKIEIPAPMMLARPVSPRFRRLLNVRSFDNGSNVCWRRVKSTGGICRAIGLSGDKLRSNLQRRDALTKSPLAAGRQTQTT